ncbi:30S ribosome-binding factor RbfA [Puteibacter caeruleilacunae]|nr:30S ribosome-binding factor RbfA [Puteibacter caeruleilacunae]
MDQEYSTRQHKISRLIQREMADIFQKEGQSTFRGKMISVTQVRVTKDLAIARCYLSIFPSDSAEELLNEINSIRGKYRGEMGRRVGKQLRVVPDLEFYIDDSLDYIENINNLLKK